MFFQVVVRDDTVEFSREPLAVLPNDITMQFAMDVENIEEAKRKIEQLLPTLKQNCDAIARELGGIGTLRSTATKVPNAEAVEVKFSKRNPRSPAR